MLAFALAATLLATPVQGGDMTRNVLVDVCLPYVTGESSDTAALDFLGFLMAPPSGEGRMFASEDEAYLLRQTTTGSVEDDNLNRVCVIQARREDLGAVRSSITPILRQQGFTAEADLPADRPIWTKGGITVSLRQNPGAATVIRVTYSSLDAGI